MAMTPKQERFIAEYLKDLNATQAAIRAGYSAHTANRIASENLSKPDVQAAVAEGQAKHLAAVDLTAIRVLEEIRRLSFSDTGALYDADGHLRPLHQLPPAVRACIASIKTTKKNLTVGDGAQEDVVEVRLWDKLRALEMAAKHFALLTERVEHSGGMDIVWKDSE
jgi:phage terminase small subunit